MAGNKKHKPKTIDIGDGRDPMPVAAAFDQALACHRDGDIQQAHALCRKIISAAPDHAGTRHLLGLIDLDRGHFEEAVSSLKQALKKQPGDPEILSPLGLAQAQTGRMKDAAGSFAAAVEAAPGNAMLQSNLGAALQELGHLDEAEAAYRQAIGIEPGNAELHFNLGTLLARARDTDGARTAYGRAAELDPHHFRAFKNLGGLLMKNADFENAAAALQTAVDLTPDDMETRIDLATALARQGKGARAIGIYREILALTSPSAKVLGELAFAHMIDRDPEAALEAAERCLALSPGGTNGIAFKAMALNELGRQDEAQEVLGLDRFLHCFETEAPAAHDSLEAFNRALIRHIENHPTLRYSSTNRSLSDGRGTDELLDRAQGPFADFERLVLAAVKRYRAAIADGREHPFTAHQPDSVRLSVWANVMDERGFHDVHFHPPGWLSGVYYPSADGIMDAGGGDGDGRGNEHEHGGWLELGGTYYMVPSEAKPKLRHVQPRPGLMVLFPSYTGLRTIPFHGQAKRISIAFDVMPAD